MSLSRIACCFAVPVLCAGSPLAIAKTHNVRHAGANLSS